jgi:hypothetical protein
MSENHQKVNWLEKLALAGRDPDKKVDMLDHARLQWGLVFSVMVVVVFIGVIWNSQRTYVHDQCEKRNLATVSSRLVLSQLADAAFADRDGNQAKVWQQWLKVSNATMPKC